MLKLAERADMSSRTSMVSWRDARKCAKLSLARHIFRFTVAADTSTCRRFPSLRSRLSMASCQFECTIAADTTTHAQPNVGDTFSLSVQSLSLAHCQFKSY